MSEAEKLIDAVAKAIDPHAFDVWQMMYDYSISHGDDPVEAADGPRYKALGNSMAVNVMRWIGRRIEMVEAIDPRPASQIISTFMECRP